MKRILITGAGSYIGTSFEKYVKENCAGELETNTLDMTDAKWRDKSFEGYDSVFHVAGIAHIKETAENAHLYYEVNRDLAALTAKKAKAEGVGQFVFLSSMSVYGMITGVITRDTVPAPDTNYGRSKLQAEEEINALADDSFYVAVLRPPMVYGKGCKGNYNSLISFAKKSPVFPRYKNKRSMVSIDTLCESVRRITENRERGYFFPQESEYICTSETVEKLAAEYGRRIKLTPLLDPAVKLMMKMPGAIGKKAKKAFGDLIYDIPPDGRR